MRVKHIFKKLTKFIKMNISFEDTKIEILLVVHKLLLYSNR